MPDLLELFNTPTRAIEPVQPLAPPRVSLYVCGPTIYNFGHIGNFRTYVAIDLLRRVLTTFGYEVDHVMQFTDVDDKTIRGAGEQGLALAEYTGRFRTAFLEDARTLNLEIPARTPNATDHIPAMVTLIERLIEKRAAYVSDDGSVYFRLTAFPRYGCLSHLDLAQLVPGPRVNRDEYEKEGIGDFVLWKRWTPPDGAVGWDSPWGRGRPGWHIECSALSMAHLGPEIDIHGGGVDLRFPHHENEIAQSESATGRPFVRHWFHVEHLLVEGEKMAKSRGNMFTVRDVLARGYTGRELRYALLTGSHYSKNLNFTWLGLDDARVQIARLDEWRHRLGLLVPSGLPASPGLSSEETFAPATDFSAAARQALAHDLNLNEALGHLFQLVRETNKMMDAHLLAPGAAVQLLDAWAEFDRLLGIGDARIEIPAAALTLLENRAAARQAKDFAASDRLRLELSTLGWTVKDTAKGQVLLPAR